MMETIALITKDSQLKAIMEKAVMQEKLLLHTVSTIQELKDLLQKNKSMLVVVDLDDILEMKDIGEDVSIVMLGNPADISKRFSQEINGRCVDIITKPIVPEILCLKLNKAFERIRLIEELKKTKRELEKVDKEAEHAYDEWEKTARVLRTSLKEVETERNKLENLNKELGRLNKVKSDLLATVSHELKTPLSSIKAFAEILLDEKIDSTERMEFLEIINNESDRLGRLINNMLTLSRVETGKMRWKMENISIDKVIKASMTQMIPIINKKKIKLKVDVLNNLPYVYGDQDKLIETLINLINNAINFTDTGGEINITAIQKEINDRCEIWVSVSDTGIGINPEEQEKIFDKFHQVKNSILTDKPEGMGLGLAICKEIVINHGGNIWVKSQYGKGSTFTFSLPVAAEQ